MPGQRDYIVLAAIVGLDGFRPVGESVALAAEFGVDYLNGLIGEFGEEQAFDFFLEPAGQGDVVGVDADALGEFAFDEQGVAGAAGRVQHPPVAGAGGLFAVFRQPDERIFAGQQHLVGVHGVGGGHNRILPMFHAVMAVFR